jgi:hypothetical protein
MIIRCALVGGTGDRDPLRVDLPTFTMVADDIAQRRAFCDVPVADIPDDVIGFVTQYPAVNLVDPPQLAFPDALKRSWREHLARRYDLGNARWNPEVA